MDASTYVVNVQGVVVRGDELLLAERSEHEEHAAGELSFPGGKVEVGPGETGVIEATVRRELREEVGVEVEGVEYVESGTFEAAGALCLNLVTRCEYAGGDARVREPEEVASVHWLTFAELAAREDAPEYTKRYAELAVE